jgi:hypothetical protein
MTRAAVVALLGLLPACLAPLAWGGPEAGLGLAGGPVYHRYRLPQDVGADLVFTSAGLSLSGDAQFVFDDRWSVNPALQFSYEPTTNMFEGSGNTEGRVFAYAALFQVRCWLGNAYAALHLGVYQEVFRSRSGQVFERGHEGGGGAVGWEQPGGLTLALLGDVESPLPGADRIFALRLNVGYRWD